jgi:hypothetical protein
MPRSRKITLIRRITIKIPNSSENEIPIGKVKAYRRTAVITKPAPSDPVIHEKGSCG